MHIQSYPCNTHFFNFSKLKYVLSCLIIFYTLAVCSSWINDCKPGTTKTPIYKRRCNLHIVAIVKYKPSISFSNTTNRKLRRFIILYKQFKTNLRDLIHVVTKLNKLLLEDLDCINLS